MKQNPEPIRSLLAIVVTWNGGEEAALAVRSLVRQSVPDRALSVLVVDNGSADDTVPRCRAEGAAVLELGENLGYGTAANRGMAFARADAYVLCNQDAIYEQGFVAGLADALDASPGAGAATAQVRLAGRFERDAEGGFVGHDGERWRRVEEGGVELLNSTGNQVTRSGNGRDRGWLAPVGTEFPRAVFGIHGGACALRAAAVAPLGGFDERYFMYYEDTDLSWRLREAGWTVVYAAEAVSVHRHAGSSGTASARFIEWNTRNRLWCALRNGPFAMRLTATTRTALSAARAGVSFLRARGDADAREAARARIRGALAGLRGARRLAAQRRAAHEDTTRGASRGVSGGASRADGGRLPVLLDFTSLPPQLGGVGRYLEGLAAGIEELGGRPRIVLRREHEAHFRALAPHAELHLAPGWIGRRGLRFLWEQTGLLRLASSVGAAAIHSPHYTFPLAAGVRRVVTVHDATFFSDPEAHTGLKRRFFAWWIRRGTRANVRLVAPSAATAREIERYAGRPARPILVAHHGVDREVFRRPEAAEVEAFRKRHGLGEAPWIAFLGTIEPRKRVGELVRAHRALCKADPDAPLLLVSGARGWDADAAAELDREAGRADSKVRELGYLPLEELRALLGGAVAFCYPSIAEGFGLPVLEAMACGAPVVATRLSALPEVAGDAAEYCEPEAASIEAALRRLAERPDLRERRAAAGLRRAGKFTWARCAELHLEAYR
ncbi:glycosyltransferase [Gulosibacter sp. 10]|uniref:glycosyltransferase n=1 Tax=Gulosibacter sp. 10 TaxID=1255570 RepID=UPI00097F3B88|nr:glycosyltransferase [Gulosibacter sp. 10]SJM66244.1 glycosyl transferase, group 1 [Gulosibacter sp. 10]